MVWCCSFLCELAVSIRTSPPSWTSISPTPSYPCRLSQGSELNSLSAIKQLSNSSLFYTWSKESKLWFSSSHAQMWEWDHKEGWALKNWCFWTVVWEKTLESPLDCKEIQPVHPKGNQSWIFTGRTDAETPILWPPDAKSRLTEKDFDAGRDWRWKEKRGTEDEMVRQHHWLNGHEFEQTSGDSEGQKSLAWCSLWSHKELEAT